MLYDVLRVALQSADFCALDGRSAEYGREFFLCHFHYAFRIEPQD